MQQARTARDSAGQQMHALQAAAAHLCCSTSTGRVTMCTWLAACTAVSGASPVIITSMWLAAASAASEGSESTLRGHWGGW